VASKKFKLVRVTVRAEFPQVGHLSLVIDFSLLSPRIARAPNQVHATKKGNNGNFREGTSSGISEIFLGLSE
jgi:hypothetical protein